MSANIKINVQFNGDEIETKVRTFNDFVTVEVGGITFFLTNAEQAQQIVVAFNDAGNSLVNK